MNRASSPGSIVWNCAAQPLLAASMLLLLSASMVTVPAGGLASATDDSGTVFVAAEAGLHARLSDGDTLWRILPDRRLHEPVVAGGVVLSAGADGLRALDALTGSTRWHTAPEVEVFSPVVARHRVYAGAIDGRLRALDITSGRIAWQYDFEGWVYSPALVGDTVLAGGSSARLVALRASDGVELWRRDVGQELVYAPLALPDSRVLVTTFAGELLVLSSTDGAQIWRHRDPVPALTPVLIDDVVVYASMDGRLRGRALDDGRLLWERDPASGRLLAPRAAGDTALVASEDGALLLLDDAGTVVKITLDANSRPLASPLRAGGQLITPMAGGELARVQLDELPVDAGSVRQVRREPLARQ